MSLMGNLTQVIFNGTLNTVGTFSDPNYSFILVGILVLSIFAYWIFMSRLGIMGLIVIIPILILILSGSSSVSGTTLQIFPSWLGVLIWTIVGVIWGYIILTFFREA